jgi:hypothetical protein
MTALPDHITRAPFLSDLGVGMFDIAIQNQYGDGSNPLILSLRLRTLLDALNYSFFFVTTGVFLQVQIGIWQAVVGRQTSAGEAAE